MKPTTKVKAAINQEQPDLIKVEIGTSIFMLTKEEADALSTDIMLILADDFEEQLNVEKVCMDI